MRLSAFTPVGLLRLSGAQPTAKLIYQEMVASLGEQLDASEGTHVEATLFARALMFARTQRLLLRSGQQTLPRYALDLLPVREAEYDLAPGVNDTVTQRRAEFAARKRAAVRGTAAAITLALQELLGDDFVAYKPTSVTDHVEWPTGISLSPMSLRSSTTARKTFTIDHHISTDLGTPHTVFYTPLDPSLPLLEGDVVVLSPESTSLAEALTVDSAGVSLGQPFFTCTPVNPHPVNAVGVTWPYAWWVSTKRYSQVELTLSAALDAEKRRKVHELMRRMARGVSTWSIVYDDGPFKVEESLIGVEPF